MPRAARLWLCSPGGGTPRGRVLVGGWGAGRGLHLMFLGFWCLEILGFRAKCLGFISLEFRALGVRLWYGFIGLYEL